MSIDQSILDKFEAVVESQLARIADMKAQDDFINYTKLDKLIIGVCGGDGIGPMITGMAQHALEALLADQVQACLLYTSPAVRRWLRGCSVRAAGRRRPV